MRPVAPRVRPKIAPRASESQYGAPRPVNAGTTHNARRIGNAVRKVFAFSSVLNNAEFVSKPLHHKAPATNTLPLKGVFEPVGARSAAATVVTRPFCDSTAVWPVWSSIKQPVPYVFFARPGSKQHWPNKAACRRPQRRESECQQAPRRRPLFQSRPTRDALRKKGCGHVEQSRAILRPTRPYEY